jgi:3-oxoadipate enol-lactonase
MAGLPVILIPGIQGHWEWMRPALAALRRTRDVRTFSLNVEDGTMDPFDRWTTEIDKAIDATGADRAVIAGVSFGGLVAVHYAATRPDRVAGVVLVSAPSPRMTLAPAEAQLIQRPLTLLPLLPYFAVRAVQRLVPEIVSAHDSWPARLSFLAMYGWQVLRKPISPRQSARWVRAWQARDLATACARVSAPVHIITGDTDLDRVVPVTSTRDYLTLIPGATASVLPRTGHVGLVSQPAAFAALVEAFIHGLDDSRSRRSA